ncbi:hypothetical protein Tco_0231670 [Tanacetum coccineum]
MTSMPKCGALCDAVGGWDWVQMMTLYCQSSVEDERNFAGRLSDLLQEMINAYHKKMDSIRELEAVSGIATVVKTAEFLNGNLWKGDKRIRKLCNMNIDVGMKADQMENFVAFCLLEDLTAFCFKTSLRFASRPHCVLLQDLIAFCFKTSLRFASRPHCVLLQAITAFCFNVTAFCSKPPLRFA